MRPVFQFGERLPDYDVLVLNEREARAGAGIFLLPALIAFMYALIDGNFAPTRVIVVAFFVDFFIRVFINPRFAPSLILGRLVVRGQVPEYVGAPQKRFAWFLGFLLSALMLYLLVYRQVVGPINMVVCVACVLLLFFETAFGICLGCKMYNAFHREKAQLCPGGVCEVQEKSPLQHVGVGQMMVLALFALMLGFLAPIISRDTHVQAHDMSSSVGVSEEERCKVPQFAKAIGHEDMWKKHHNCL